MATDPRIKYDILASTQGEQEVERLAQALEKVDQAIDPQASQRAQELAAQLRQLGAQQAAIQTFAELKDRVTQAREALELAQQKAQEFARELANSETTTRAQQGQLQKLSDTVRDAKQALQDQVQQLDASRAALTKLGLSTDELAATQVRVRSEIRAAAQAAVASAAEYGKLAELHQRAGATAAEEAEAERRAAAVRAESLAATQQAIERAGQALQEAFAQTGVRSIREIEAEIASLNQATSTLQREFLAGTISVQDFDRASASAALRVEALRAEIVAVPKVPGTFEKLSSDITGLIGRFGALTAAVAGAGIVVKPLLDAQIALEQVRRALTTVTGSADQANRSIEFLRDVAQRSGQSFADLAQSYGRFAASALQSGLSISQVQEVFSSVTLAAGNLGLSSEKVTNALDALGQIASKGVVSMEELRQQLGDALPGVLPALAKELGLTQKQLQDLVSSGQLLASDAIPAIGRALANLGPAAGQGVSSITAEFNRLKNVVTEAATSIGEGAIGNALGGAFAALSYAVQRVAFGITFIGESFTVVGRQIGTVIAALVSRDFKNLGDALQGIERDSTERLARLADRIGGVGTSAAGAATQVASTSERVQQAVAAIGSVTDQAAAAQGRIGAATATAGAQAGQAANNWVRLSVVYGQQIADAEKATRVAESLAEAKQKEGEAAARVAELAGDEIEARVAASRAAADTAAALRAVADARAREAAVLTAQRDALVQTALATGRNDEATKNALKALQDSITAKEAEAEKAREVAQASSAEAAARKIAAETVKDSSSRYVEFRIALQEAELALVASIDALGRDKGSLEEVNAKTLEVAKAKALLRDAINDTAKADERAIAAMKADAELAKQMLEVDLARARVKLAEAQATGTDTQARQAAIVVRQLELALDNQAIDSRRAEANEIIRSTVLRMEELRAANALTPEIEAELSLRIKQQQAILLSADASKIAADAAQQQFEKIKSGSEDLDANTAATTKNTSAVDANTTSRTKNTKAAEDAAAAQARLNALMQADPTRLVSGSGLGGITDQPRTIPPSSSSLGDDIRNTKSGQITRTLGFQLTPPDNTPGWEFDTAKYIANGSPIFATNEQAFPYWRHKPGTVPGTGQGGNAFGGKAGTPPAPNIAPAPAPAPGQPTATPSSVVRIDLNVNGKTYPVNAADQASADALLAALQSAKRLAGY